jgi:hypothetical protein
MRLHSAAAKGNPTNASLLATRARALPGVIRVSANPLTGSLVIWYDARSQDRGALLLALGAQVLARPERSTEGAWVWVRPVIAVLAERLAERLLRMAIAAII